MASNAFLQTIASRRTYYALKPSSPIPDSRIQSIVKELLVQVPSSFNSQSNRAVILFKDEHKKLWDIVKEVLKGVVSEEQWKQTEPKLDMFAGGYATILFFEDSSVVTSMQEKFPTYHEKFPVWATQSVAMLQFAIWTTLEAEGLGANLQHYNPLINERVAKEWGLDENWKLNAQMIIGEIAAPAKQKTVMELEKRFKVFGA
ncbi:Nitroreductase-like protein [Leptodontidium sp. 2 PMI_412]|nr:Nitroreductase-like protein [Leptodontidium sp. 2 PMI_412]